MNQVDSRSQVNCKASVTIWQSSVLVELSEIRQSSRLKELCPQIRLVTRLLSHRSYTRSSRRGLPKMILRMVSF